LEQAWRLIACARKPYKGADAWAARNSIPNPRSHLDVAPLPVETISEDTLTGSKPASVKLVK
jgi:hypothetical protein